MTDEQRESLQAGQLEDWLFESYSIAGDIYARTPDGSKLGFNYNYIYNATIEKQLQRAGMRLAKLLNDIYR
jgi:hypothetical protein